MFTKKQTVTNLRTRIFFNVLTWGGESTIGLKCADDGLIRNPEIKYYVGLEHFDGCRRKIHLSMVQMAELLDSSNFIAKPYTRLFFVPNK